MSLVKKFQNSGLFQIPRTNYEWDLLSQKILAKQENKNWPNVDNEFTSYSLNPFNYSTNNIGEYTSDNSLSGDLHNFHISNANLISDLQSRLDNAEDNNLKFREKRLLKKRIKANEAYDTAGGDLSKLSKSQQRYVGDDSTVTANIQQHQQHLQLVGNTLNNISNYTGVLDSILPISQQSALTAGLNSAYDTTANNLSSIPGVGSIIGGAMKIGGLLSDGLTSIGVGTDQMTTADKILDSKFLKLTPMGLINAIGAKKADTINKDSDLFSSIGSAYDSIESDVDNATEKSGKKYGLFSNKSRKKANRQIQEAIRQQLLAGDINNLAQQDFTTQQSMSDIYANKLAFNQQGGWNTRMSIGKNGFKIFSKDDINKVRNIIKHQQGNKLKPLYKDWIKTVPQSRLNSNYDLEKAYEVLPFETLEGWKKASDEDLLNSTKYHLKSIYELPNGDYEFLKLGTKETNPEVHLETDTYYDGSNGLKDTHDLIFDKDSNRYYYRQKKSQKYQKGGAFNVIPDGALHARLHHMDIKGITKKGIPVIIQKDNGEIEQQAEIERNEIIFNLDTTKELEKLWREGTDEAAIKAGKILVKEILENTMDNTGLINSITE